MTEAVKIVNAWHTTLNNGNMDELVTLVDENVAIHGPRGVAQGKAIFREWFARANAQFIPLRWFNRDSVVVVEQEGRWLSPETGEVTGQQILATAFVVEGGVIRQILRYDSLEESLNAAGLTLQHAINLS
jgi:hypothetical protein